ncbi:hypothetical protein Tco_1063950 [Tanacetum coccineum]
MPYSCDRRGMWDGRVSIGHTSKANSGLSILEPLMKLIIEHCTGKFIKINFKNIFKLEPLSDGWTDFLQEQSIPGISLKGLYLKTMADHSKKWHDGTSNRNIEGSSNSKGIAAIESVTPLNWVTAEYGSRDGTS